MPRLILASALAVLAAACSSSSETIASCALGADTCYDYPNNADSQLTLQACVGPGGVNGQYAPYSCPSLNLVGTCADVPGQLIVGTLVRYYSPNFTPTTAGEACSLIGGTPQ
jgi:hypothetical protein